MTRVLVFEGEKGKRRFELAYNGFLSGGTTPTPNGAAPPVDRATIRQRATILRAFKAKLADTGTPTATPIPLPFEIRLEQPDFLLLEKHIEQTPWMVHVADDVDDLFDFLSSAEKVE